jgi:hypothetical protein
MKKTNKSKTKRNQAQKQPPSAMAHSAPVPPNPMSAAEFLDAYEHQLTRAALSTWGRAKSKFLSVSYQ